MQLIIRDLIYRSPLNFMSEESVNSRRCKGGNLFFSRILFCICLCGPVAYALAEESTVVSEIRQKKKNLFREWLQILMMNR